LTKTERYAGRGFDSPALNQTHSLMGALGTRLVCNRKFETIGVTTVTGYF